MTNVFQIEWGYFDQTSSQTLHSTNWIDYRFVFSDTIFLNWKDSYASEDNTQKKNSAKN